jgi:hypothetical protein
VGYSEIGIAHIGLIRFAAVAWGQVCAHYFIRLQLVKREYAAIVKSNKDEPVL